MSQSETKAQHTPSVYDPEAKHTPGPWVVEVVKSGRTMVYARINSADGRHLAFAGNYRNHRGTAANARLIAAAPELLAALREIAETPCDHGPGFCARKIAQAALKQAEGRGA